MAIPDMDQNVGQGGNEQASGERLQFSHWGVSYDMKLRWQRGPQFGERQVVYTCGTDDQGEEKVIGQPKYGEWTWYNWRGKRVEGPEQGGPVFSATFSEGKASMTVNPSDKPE